MTVQERSGPSIELQLQPLITRELEGIAAIAIAIAHEAAPDYVVMFQDAKNGKQANVEQMTTLLRMQGGAADERGGLRKVLTTSQAAVGARLGTTMVLRSMRLAEVDLVKRYTDALADAEGLTKRALTKALGRALVHAHVLTAHLAKRTGDQTACGVTWIGRVVPVRSSGRIHIPTRTCALRATTRPSANSP